MNIALRSFLRHVALIAAFFFLNLYLFSQTTVYQKDKWGAKLYYVDETNTMRIKDKWGDKLYYFDGKTIRLKDKATRDALQASLKAAGIPAMVYYPRPMHLQTAFAGLNARPCANATSLSDRVLSLPMHPYLTEKDIIRVCDSIKDLSSSFSGLK